MSNDMQDALGFTWDSRAVRSLPAYTPQRAIWRFRRVLAEYVWDAGQLEGNPFTFPEVQTLMDHITVGGKRLTDEQQILGLWEAANELARLVGAGTFDLSKDVSDDLHLMIARGEAFDAGMFRGEGREMSSPHVFLGKYGEHTPPPTERGGANLRAIWVDGASFITNELRDPFEQGAAYFLFGALQQFYHDGNKRTSRYMMNGWLMSHGIDAISIPARRRQEFNTEMTEFYYRKDATGMFQFLATCWQDGQR